MTGRRARTPWWMLSILTVALGTGAAPSAPSYLPIDQGIDRAEAALKEPGGRQFRTAPGWTAFLGALRTSLRDYASARTENDRLRALGRLYQFSVALRGTTWAPAAQVREELRAWLRPRVRLAWAERRLIDHVLHLPPTSAATTRSNRSGWVRYVDDELGAALRDYESAPTVYQRRTALQKVYAALNTLRHGNEAHPWSPSLNLETALNDLFNQRNLDLTADLAAVSPALNQNLITDGPVFFKGQWSYVKAGPKTGFGLFSSDEGIGFYNSQAMTSTTNINGFNQQMEQDPRGRRATKLYHFDASSVDGSQLTMYALIGTDGLRLWPAYQHNVGASVSSEPTQGGGLGRAIAGLIGMNQRKITQKVWEGAYPKIAQGVEEGAMELGTIRANEAAAQQNVKLRQYLVGNNTLKYKNLAVTQLSLRSRPQFIMATGTVTWPGAGLQVGADAPQPARFESIQSGVSADVHLPSIMTNLCRGYLQTDAVKDIHNLMIVTRKIPPGAPPSEGIVTSKNVGFEEFRQAVAEARAANDPKVVAIRVKRPGQAPEFSADARGFLVAHVHDFAIEVPAPPQAAKGGGLAGPPADIYMMACPDAEFVISFKIEPAKLDPQGGQLPIQLSGRIEDFDPGYGARVYAVTTDESKATPLTSFTSAIALRLFGAKLHGQPISIPLSNIQLKGYDLASVSPLDPSGWMRFVLAPTAQRPRLHADRGTAPEPTVATVRLAGKP